MTGEMCKAILIYHLDLEACHDLQDQEGRTFAANGFSKCGSGGGSRTA